jgi:uncharacterized protein YjbJ (UPF0337 family)
LDIDENNLISQKMFFFDWRFYMNKELFETQWAQIRNVIRDRWNHLTDEDIRQINGRYDQLINKLQQRYGYTRDTAEDEVRNWAYDRTRAFATTGLREDETWRTRRAEDNTALKWILAIGIPLLLIASYLAYQNARTPQETFATAREAAVFTETPEDRVVSQNIRRALFESDRLTPDTINNIRVETSNGIVTLRGNVPTNQDRDLIQRIVENVRGTRQINNQVQVR